MIIMCTYCQLIPLQLKYQLHCYINLKKKHNTNTNNWKKRLMEKETLTALLG